MGKEIQVEVIDGFILYNHDETTVLADTNDGDVFIAVLHEPTREYFAKDIEGREFLVGHIGCPGELIIEEGMRLIDEP